MNYIVDNRFCAVQSAQALRFEDVHSPYNILPADRTFIHPLATLGAGHHVPTLKENAVDHGIHTDPAKVVIRDCQRSLFTVCKE